MIKLIVSLLIPLYQIRKSLGTNIHKTKKGIILEVLSCVTHKLRFYEKENLNLSVKVFQKNLNLFVKK